MPDIVVDLQSTDGKEHATTTPVVVIEVLSPSTDLAFHLEKLSKYAQLPSLIRYAMFSQDGLEVHLWRKVQAVGLPLRRSCAAWKARSRFREVGAVLALADIFERRAPRVPHAFR